MLGLEQEGLDEVGDEQPFVQKQKSEKKNKTKKRLKKKQRGEEALLNDRATNRALLSTEVM